MLSPCGGDSDARRYGMQASTLSPDSRGNITISRYVDTVVKRWQRYAGDQALGTSTFLLPGIRVRSSFVQVSVPPHGKEAKPMHGKKQFRNSLFQVISRAAAAVLAIVVLFSLMLILTQSAPAQTFTVLHNFTGGLDGRNPYAGLTMDAAGNLYGTTCGAVCATGESNAGTVFRLSKRGPSWLFIPLYTFRGGNDGAGPAARVIVEPNGSLSGTTMYGGGSGCGGSGCGTVFNLKPPPSVPPNVFGAWTETVLYSFQGGSDGAYPGFGDLVFDPSGNIYGTTGNGGNANAGMVFQLTPSGGGWRENVLYTFTGGYDGNGPLGGVILGSAGNLYGTTFQGGDGSCLYGPCGTVFELTPSGSGYIETVLHNFQGGSDGSNPIGGVAQGNYGTIGTTSIGGTNGGGTAFILNSQMFLYSFPGNNYTLPWPGPWSNLVYGAIGPSGTTYADGAHQYGSVFYMYGCAGWDAVTLHDFTGGLDGAYPVSSLLFDANGNIFGTTSEGGAYGFGVVLEITGAQDSQIGSAESSTCAKDH